MECGVILEFIMQADEKLDLCGFIKPYCLLQCKSVLASMKHGRVLEIRVGDPETYTDLLTILERSGEKILSSRKRRRDFLIRVRKHGKNRDGLPSEQDA